jgi:ubiquinone/menaquinone biosynthesis C-methylase UbiE
MQTTKQLIKELSPPLIWKFLRSTKRYAKLKLNSLKSSSDKQNLTPYWDENIAKLLDIWGEGNAWNEIGMLLLEAEGKVLDIACGTGKVMTILTALNPKLDIHGCDISDLLIGKAQNRGVKKENLIICDATNMSCYKDNSFDYSYTIGSLEHFTEEGIAKLISETKRVVKGKSFHMMPVSRSDKNEGWLTNHQSFWNNSVAWWLEKFKKDFSNVRVFESAWNDELSFGKWFVTEN